MLNITGHGLTWDDGYLELSVDLQYEVEDKEVTGLEFYATIEGQDGSLFATPVGTALLEPDENEASIFKSFPCPDTFVGEKVTVHYRAFSIDDGGVVDLGTPIKDTFQLLTDLKGANWEAGALSTVGVKVSDDSADLTVTLSCKDPRDWAWLVTPLSGDARSYSNFEPFGGASSLTFETNTYEIENGIQLDVHFLRAGPNCTVSIDL